MVKLVHLNFPDGFMVPSEGKVGVATDKLGLDEGDFSGVQKIGLG